MNCFQIMAIENSAAVNMGLQVSHWDSDFTYFGCISRREITGSNGSSIFIFLRTTPHTIFHNGYMNIHPHRLYKEGSALWHLAILPANPQLQYGFIAFTLNLQMPLGLSNFEYWAYLFGFCLILDVVPKILYYCCLFFNTFNRMFYFSILSSFKN